MSQHRRITDEGVAGLPISEGRAELLEEIMTSTPTIHRTSRGLLVPLAAAAAVVAVAGGAWALSAGDEPAPSPKGPGFGAEQTSPAEPPSETVPSATPTAEGEHSCVVAYDKGTTPPATDGPEFADCDRVYLEEQSPGDFVQEERYQRPPRPALITAEGWEVEGVYNMDLDWEGPGDGKVHVTWLQAASPDPFATDRYERPGERIDVLGLDGRLTGFTERGKDYQVLFTSPVKNGGPGLLLETSSLGPAEFRAVVESLRWVTLDEYDAVVRPAVG